MERRRSPRFGLAVPLDARVSVLQDVEIEHAGEDDFIVLSAVAGIRGEEMTLRIGPSDAVQMTAVVRTMSSDPCVTDGRLVHRLRLAVTGAIALSSAGGGASSWRSGDKTTTVVIRHHPARVLNLNRGGCLFELSTRLPAGTVAALHRPAQSANPEAIRVNFLQERRGAPWPYAAGGEFLPLSAPTSHSLRALAVRLTAEAAEPGLVGTRQESGLRLTNSVLGPVDILSIICAEQGNGEQPRARMGVLKSQSKTGKPLALVGVQDDSPEHS